MRATVLAFAALTALSGAALAHAAGGEEDRYRLERSGDSYVRLDTRTGAMSLCQEDGEQLVCRLAADERGAYEDELQRLQDRLDALEDRVSALEGARAAPVTEGEFEQSLDMMEKFFRRFMGVMKDFDPDRPEDGPAPDRT